jgi:hypothetical protein
VIDRFRKVWPEFCQGNDIVVPPEVTLEHLNQRLSRVGIEAWSRFPGLSVQLRYERERVNEPFKPFYDEIGSSRALTDKRAEILAKLTKTQRRMLRKAQLGQWTVYEEVRTEYSVWQEICADKPLVWSYFFTKRNSMQMTVEHQMPPSQFRYRGNMYLTSYFVSSQDLATQLYQRIVWSYKHVQGGPLWFILRKSESCPC